MPKQFLVVSNYADSNAFSSFVMRLLTVSLHLQDEREERDSPSGGESDEPGCVGSRGFDAGGRGGVSLMLLKG